MSSGRRGGLRSHGSRAEGRTRDQLYNEAASSNIEGRSKMNKAQLQRAVDARRSLGERRLVQPLRELGDRLEHGDRAGVPQLCSENPP